MNQTQEDDQEGEKGWAGCAEATRKATLEGFRKPQARLSLKVSDLKFGKGVEYERGLTPELFLCARYCS